MECLAIQDAYYLGRFLSPEQATAACDTWRNVYENVWLPLAVPGATEWNAALRAAFVDSRAAWSSTSHFWFLTLRPLVIFVSMALHWFSQLFWNYVIVKGISQQGVFYVTSAGRHLYQWQRSLTRRQMMIEFGILVSVIALFYVHRFLKRQTYFQRMAKWVRAKVLKLQLYYDRTKRLTAKTYERTVRKIATTSLRLAVMMPHLFFVGMAAVAKMLMPSFLRWLACDTAILPVLQLWYPLVATIFLLHDMQLVQLSRSSSKEADLLLQTPQKQSSSSSPQKKTPLSRIFPRTTPASIQRQQKRREVNEMKERESYWLQFWMTSAAFLCGKRFVAALPFVQRLVNRYEWGTSGLMQLELLFYIWVFVMPYLLPQIANAPEGRPLFLLEPKIIQMVKVVYKSTLVFSDTWWQTWVITPLTTGLNLLVTLRMLSKSFADELRDVVMQSKALLLPCASLFMPRFLSIFGLLFVQYALPLHKQSIITLRKGRHVMLRYWVIHILLSLVTEATESILWWIPLSRVLTFAAFVVIGTSQAVVDMCVRMLLHDLEVFRLLPSTNDGSKEEQPRSSWAARGVHALLERLPKAKDTMTPAKAAMETTTEEQSALVQENVSNPVYRAEEEEVDDAVLYSSSDDDPDARSSSEGSDAAYRPTEESISAQRSRKQLSKRSKTKTKVAADKENERNVHPAPTRRSGRQRTRTERLSS